MALLISSLPSVSSAKTQYWKPSVQVYKTSRSHIYYNKYNSCNFSGQVYLGYGIVGYTDAGAGTSAISWNEGRWTISVLSTNPDNYDNPAGTDLYGQPLRLAKQVVAYLHKHRLPAPHKYGRIQLYADVRPSIVEWQQYKRVYSLTGSSDPLRLVKSAVVYGR